MTKKKEREKYFYEKCTNLSLAYYAGRGGRRCCTGIAVVISAELYKLEVNKLVRAGQTNCANCTAAGSKQKQRLINRPG